MPYLIQQWPDSVQRKEIDSLPLDASSAVMVMLREMRNRGPWPEEYKIKPLSGHLHGLKQANLKVNREQIRMLFSVYGLRIVVLHVFKKTSPQSETNGYKLALERKKNAEILSSGGSSDLTTIH
jgi:phage-related protein